MKPTHSIFVMHDGAQVCSRETLNLPPLTVTISETVDPLSELRIQSFDGQSYQTQTVTLADLRAWLTQRDVDAVKATMKQVTA
jgi:hypothetical protein